MARRKAVTRSTVTVRTPSLRHKNTDTHTTERLLYSATKVVGDKQDVAEYLPVSNCVAAVVNRGTPPSDC